MKRFQLSAPRWLRRFNHLRTSRIVPGQELVIHDEGHVPAHAEAKVTQGVKPGANGENVLIYTVKKGDTIWEIARAHNVEPRDLKSWNDITRNKIFAGQELIIHVSPADSRQ